MAEADSIEPEPPRWQVPAWFERVARLSWGFVGVVLALGAIVFVLSTLRELVIPLVLAGFFAAVFAPGVDWLEARKVPRSVGSLIVLVVINAIVWGSVVIVVFGVVDQVDELSQRFDEAQTEIEDLIDQSEFNGFIDDLRENAGGGGAVARDGLGAQIGTFLDSASGFISGLVLGLVLLYYLLKDGSDLVRGFVARQKRQDTEQYNRIISQAGSSVRGYFKGKSILAAVQGVFVAAILAIMDVPLPGSIGIVNFIGAYIPFLGAFIGGAFAVLMALSEGGVGLAISALAVVLFMNVVLENVIEPKLLGSSLALHPIVVLLSTVAGGVTAGLVGLVLAAPLTSIGINLFRELRISGFFADESGSEE